MHLLPFLREVYQVEVSTVGTNTRQHFSRLAASKPKVLCAAPSALCSYDSIISLRLS